MIKACISSPVLRYALAAVVVTSLMSVVGCEEWADESRYNAPDDHTVSKKKARHLPGLNDPGINCIQCHGLDLAGGSAGVSCYECHGRKWTGTDAAGAEHTLRKGDALHRVGLTDPAANCASCHGSNLRGGSVGVSCYQCHGELWAGGAAFSSTHTVNEDGALHRPGLNSPAANCASCHGSDLRGGSVGVSCFKCHGNEWSDDDGDDD